MVRWEALDALSRQLELCGIGADTNMVVLIDPAIDHDQLAQIRVAVARCGASVVEVHTAPEQCVNNAPLGAAVTASDIIITTGRHDPNGFAGSQALHLHPVAPDAFAPHASLRRRTHALVHAIDTADVLTLTDANGSNLSVTLADAAVDLDHGLLAEDLPRASFPAGWVSLTPADTTVHGKIVLMPGDASLGADQLIMSPVVLELVDDHVSVIHGDSPDADMVRALLEHPGEASAYGIAEISIGLNPGVDTSAFIDNRLLDPIVSKLLAGVVRLSFGENLHADRPCRQTITMALPGRSLHIDGLPIVAHGQLQGDIAPDVYEL